MRGIGVNERDPGASVAQAAGFAGPMVGSSLDGSWIAGLAARLFRVYRQGFPRKTGVGRRASTLLIVFFGSSALATDLQEARAVLGPGQLASVEKSAFKVETTARELETLATRVHQDQRLHSLTLIEDQIDELESQVESLSALIAASRRPAEPAKLP